MRARNGTRRSDVGAIRFATVKRGLTAKVSSSGVDRQIESASITLNSTLTSRLLSR
jgi:hypothetical protein